MPDPLLNAHDGVLFDLDGVLYTGPHAVGGAPEAVAELRERGMPHAFVTNNASRSAEAVAAHLRQIGIAADPEQVFGSAPVGVRMLAQALPSGARVLVTGSDYLRSLVAQAGFLPVTSAQERPDAVIQGFDPSLGWEDLAEASYAVGAGAQWFATNLDRSIPQERGTAPGNGSLVEAVAAATGAWPQAAGKPEPVMFQTAAEALDVSRPLVVGDRLDTDILGGNRAGYGTALVLTGVDTEQTAAKAADDMRPAVVLKTLTDLFSGAHRRLQERSPV